MLGEPPSTSGRRPLTTQDRDMHIHAERTLSSLLSLFSYFSSYHGSPNTDERAPVYTYTPLYVHRTPASISLYLLSISLSVYLSVPLYRFSVSLYLSICVSLRYMYLTLYGAVCTLDVAVCAGASVYLQVCLKARADF